jgi:hypothetical protein
MKDLNSTKNSHKIRYILDHDFHDYHLEFLGSYCILPLTSKIKTPAYYKNKLTSSINYAKAYNLNIIIDNDLQDIYEMKNAYIYNDNLSLVEAFKKTLHDFYNNRRFKFLELAPL